MRQFNTNIKILSRSILVIMIRLIHNITEGDGFRNTVRWNNRCIERTNTLSMLVLMMNLPLSFPIKIKCIIFIVIKAIRSIISYKSMELHRKLVYFNMEPIWSKTIERSILGDWIIWILWRQLRSLKYKWRRKLSWVDCKLIKLLLKAKGDILLLIQGKYITIGNKIIYRINFPFLSCQLKQR